MMRSTFAFKANSSDIKGEIEIEGDIKGEIEDEDEIEGDMEPCLQPCLECPELFKEIGGHPLGLSAQGCRKPVTSTDFSHL